MQRRQVRETMDRLNKAGFQRLARKAGVRRMSGLMYDEFREYLRNFLVNQQGIVESKGKHPLQFSRTRFARVIRDTTQKPFTDSEVEVIQRNCEDHLIQLMHAAYQETQKAKRICMFPKDFLKVLNDRKLGKYADE